MCRIRGCRRSSGGGSLLWRGGSAGGWDYCMPMVRLSCAPGAVMTCIACACYVDGRPGALPVSSRCAQGARDELLRLASAAGHWDCPSACVSLRQEAEPEVGGAAPGAGKGRWCEKTTKKTREGGGYVCCAACVSCVDGARVSPCYLSCRLAVRVPREEHIMVPYDALVGGVCPLRSVGGAGAVYLTYLLT